MRSGRLVDDVVAETIQPVSIRVAGIDLEAPVSSVGVDGNNQFAVPTADTVGRLQRAIARADGGRWSVRKVEGEGAAARVVPTTVELGLSDGLITEVTAGLVEGDRVLLPEGGGRGRGRP